MEEHVWSQTNAYVDIFMQIVKMVAAIPSVGMVSRVPFVLSSSSLLPFHFAVGSKLTLQRSKNQNKHLLNCIY